VRSRSPSTDATLAGSSDSPHHKSEPASDPIPGEFVGRYLVLSRVGAGAMGVVFAAYDPELDRRVAVKLLQRRRLGSTADGRLQREAQALARLNHPNVVAVHDVGSHDGRVFLAMEFVQGVTLTEWMASDGEPRPWRAVVSVFLAAGRGLEAAHAQGLAHRDFKPDNVMLGEDGRVRVMDFGLARATELPRSAGKSLEASEPELRQSTDLTRSGAIVGTPAYMALEQFAGQVATPRSDQFAFSVALFEALYGQRPFPGDTVAALSASVTDGELVEVEARRPVPLWLRRVVRRGLQGDPDARFDSMRPLLDVLASGDQRRRRRIGIAIGVAVSLVCAGAFGWVRHRDLQREDACLAAGDEIATVWDDRARDRVVGGIRASGTVDAADTASKAVPWIDRQAERWREHRIEACRHALVHRDWGEVLYDKARQCLDDRRVELSILVDGLTAPDALSASRAVNAAAALNNTLACVDEVALSATPVVPDAATQERTRARRQVARASYLDDAGRYVDAVEAGRAAMVSAEASEFALLLAEARLATSIALMGAGDHAASEGLAEQSYGAAARLGSWSVAARAANHLIYLVGYRLRRPSEGRRWAEHAAIAIVHAADPAEILEAARAGALSAVANREGRFSKAIELNAKARGIYERSLGPTHPLVAARLSSEANNLRRRGDFAQAAAKHQASLEIREQTLGANHPDLASGLSNLANVYWSMDDAVAAVPLYRRSLAIREAGLGDEHPLVATSLRNLSLALRGLGDLKGAREAAERGLAIRRRLHSGDHPDIATSLEDLGVIALRENNRTDGRPLLEESLAIFGRTLGAEHPRTVSVWRSLSELHHASAEYGEAVATAEKAVERAQGNPEDPIPLARSRATLAIALWDATIEQGGDRNRARTLAVQASEGLKHLGGRSERHRAEIEAWLSARAADD